MPEDPSDPQIARASARPVRSRTSHGRTGPTAEEFRRRVDEELVRARNPRDARRTVHTLAEIAAARHARRYAAVWSPLATFAVIGICAALVALLMTTLASPGHGWAIELLAAIATLAVIAVGFGALLRTQDHFDVRRPGGRVVRAEVAHAYETVREGTVVLLELGVPPSALAMVADLLPRADRMLDALVEHETRGKDVCRHQAYDVLLRMAAEVTVLTDMAEERMGRRSGLRRDRPVAVAKERADQTPAERALATLEVISDLVEMLGPDVPRQRAGPGTQVSRPP